MTLAATPPTIRQLVLRITLVLGAALLSRVAVAGDDAAISLPTPTSHFVDFDIDGYVQTLVLQLAVTLPADQRGQAMALVERAKKGGDDAPTAPEIRAVMEAAGWGEHRSAILRILLHRSNVLDVLPDVAAERLPLVHDSLLFFLGRLSDERLVDRIVEQALLPPDAERGERVLAFIKNTPSLQKLAQILARNPDIAPDFRESLQTLENGIETAQYDDVRAQIENEMPKSVRDEYEIRFADSLLAEASVGAVLEASFRIPGSTEPGRAACKVLKPYAVAALRADLAIIDELLLFLESNGELYGIGALPLVDIFVEVREALSREVRVEDERDNLRRASRYYMDDSQVIVPELYPFSTENVTCMEFIAGTKITDAFLGRPADRAALADRLSDVMTYDVLFATNETALFHGDPHAGNVFHAPDGSDPYRIALIDWGLAAEFDRVDREKIIQLMLGLYLGHAKRLANNIEAVVDWTPRTPEERERMRERMERVIESTEGGGMFSLLDTLVQQLATDGFPVKFNATMFIKSQLTISGILAELDPSFEQDDHVMGRISSQVTRELHVRLLRTLWFPQWNSHSYRSMMSNEDVKDVQFQKVGRGFKAFGGAVWKGVTFQWLRHGGSDDTE